MRKRIFSILLTIAVCLSMMPAGVWAAEAGTHTAHCVCGGNGDVNGHEHDTAGTQWTTADSLPGSAGSYYLTQSVSGELDCAKGRGQPLPERADDQRQNHRRQRRDADADRLHRQRKGSRRSDRQRRQI